MVFTFYKMRQLKEIPDGLGPSQMLEPNRSPHEIVSDSGHIRLLGPDPRVTSSPTSGWAGKCSCRHPCCLHNIVPISAVPFLCANTYGESENYALGYLRKTAFGNVLQMGSCATLVTCSELPAVGYSLVNPRCKPWPPYSEPC